MASLVYRIVIDNLTNPRRQYIYIHLISVRYLGLHRDNLSQEKAKDIKLYRKLCACVLPGLLMGFEGMGLDLSVPVERLWLLERKQDLCHQACALHSKVKRALHCLSAFSLQDMANSTLQNNAKVLLTF
ncbi:unnamed protein product [Citrullus colocynthis]|uniref:Uncharacterized protein n=1 Tax=Citrullus colocynthis TaxID=252529 RepID=A0ABP0Y3D5_9ROSI